MSADDPIKQSILQEEECTCCGSTQVFTNEHECGSGEIIYVCDLCFNTGGISRMEYHGNGDKTEILAVVCYIGNEILKKLNK